LPPQYVAGGLVATGKPTRAVIAEELRQRTPSCDRAGETQIFAPVICGMPGQTSLRKVWCVNWFIGIFSLPTYSCGYSLLQV
jgi:hypothetical protein